MEKPQNMNDFLKWFKKDRKVTIGSKDRDYYNSVANTVRQDFEESKLWTELLTNLRSYDQEYQVLTGYALFIPGFEPEIKVKSFESFLEKIYRKNVLNNDSWPREPEGNWIIPENWFSRINDIVRTLFIVKYFDGVDFLIERIENLCKKHNLELVVDKEAREEGYYAVHLYVKQEFEIPKELWDTKRVPVSIELQITTQLQEVIRKLLHDYYEKKRMMIEKPIEKWQWDYKCDEFCVNYLGHILHYIEGMIMEVRERQKGEIK